MEDSIENNMGSCLDVYYLQSEMSLCQRERVIYYMGLLAHAAVCGQKDMVELLLRKGASKDFENRSATKFNLRQ